MCGTKSINKVKKRKTKKNSHRRVASINGRYINKVVEATEEKKLNEEKEADDDDEQNENNEQIKKTKFYWRCGIA